jgi:hypothetical protein
MLRGKIALQKEALMPTIVAMERNPMATASPNPKPERRSVTVQRHADEWRFSTARDADLVWFGVIYGPVCGGTLMTTEQARAIAANLLAAAAEAEQHLAAGATA